MYISIHRNGVLISSRVSVSLSVASITTRLVGITITGTDKSIIHAVLPGFGGSVGIDTGFVSLQQMFSFNIKGRIDTSIIASVELKLAAHLVATLGKI